MNLSDVLKKLAAQQAQQTPAGLLSSEEAAHKVQQMQVASDAHATQLKATVGIGAGAGAGAGASVTESAKALAPSEAPAQHATPATQPAPAPTPGRIILNHKQQAALQLATQGSSFVLIGAAGTGKTTTLAACATTLLANYDASELAMVAFTNTAAKNIGRAMSKYPELKSFAKERCTTIHRLLQFRPVPYSYRTETGEYKDSMRFEPTHDAYNPILSLRLVIVEEASMLGLPLWKQLMDACPNANFIFVGDLNQIPPVMSDSILGFKLLELPVVELTDVYRQAMDSPIISFQHNYTLKGTPCGDSLLPTSGPLQFRALKTFIRDEDAMCRAAASNFKSEFLAGTYNPQEDIILIPFNKRFGTVKLNTLIAQFLGEHRNAVVHEVIAGFEKHYLAVGDRVRYKKDEYVISAISANASYRGTHPQEASTSLTRLGTHKSLDSLNAPAAEWDFNEMLTQVDSMDDDDTKNDCSHVITLTATTCWEGEEPAKVSISTRGDLNEMDFGYCLTVHKSQGSEWRKVYLIMTKHHAVMCNREILYTGMTRAREELVVVYSPASAPGKKDSSLSKAISNPRIPGRCWNEKKAYFLERKDEYMQQMHGDSNGLNAQDAQLLKDAETLL